ncbi:hypothetical protein HKD37_04G010192 [Glycine soja]
MMYNQINYRTGTGTGANSNSKSNSNGNGADEDKQPQRFRKLCSWQVKLQTFKETTHASAPEWLDELAKQKWVQCFDEGKTHIVNELDRHNHTFIITETQFTLQTPRSHGRFRVMIQSQKCDCGEYQPKHLPCCHVMASCKSVNVDPMTYWAPDPRRKTTVKGRPISTRIPTKMDEDENEQPSTKKKWTLPATWS